MNRLLKKIKVPKHKKDVLLESLGNTAIGFVVAYAFTVIIGPYILGAAINHETSFTWTLAMTFVSIIRGYFIRLYYSRKRYIEQLRKELKVYKRKAKKAKKNG